MADEKFTKIVRSQGISADGKAWLTRVLDPFHDNNIAIAGIPDHDTDATAIQYIRRKVSLVAPDPTGTWACHICTLPWQENFEAFGLKTSTQFALQGDVGGNGKYTLGTVTVIRHLDTENGFPDGSFVHSATRLFDGYSPTEGNTNSMHKLIAGGFEVHNDTASLYKSGNVGVYVAPTSTTTTSRYASKDNGATQRMTPIEGCRQPPSTPAAMALFPETRNWEAAQGCLVPFRLAMAAGSEFHPLSQSVPALLYSDDTSLNDNWGMMANFTSVGATQAGANYPTDTDTGTYGFHKSGLQTTGAYFSGLANESALTLDLLFICEVAPTATNPAMLSMTSPTARYDPIALREYCNIVSRLPPGVPVSQNAHGDWWRNIVRVAAQVGTAVAPVILATGHPVAAGATLLAAQTANKTLAVIPASKTKKGNGHGVNPNMMRK
jgi:hypothetical protein